MPAPKELFPSLQLKELFLRLFPHDLCTNRTSKKGKRETAPIGTLQPKAAKELKKATTSSEPTHSKKNRTPQEMVCACKERLLCAGLLAHAEQLRQGALFFGYFFWASSEAKESDK